MNVIEFYFSIFINVYEFLTNAPMITCQYNT